ncbi:adenylate/guanylate cyclase domain-containing protein [Rhodobacteraceae bacterium M382]|nr:adenylate/guanylate cyclase domain-containing protein [Rhodobacteraceae bacterium M382]
MSDVNPDIALLRAAEIESERLVSLLRIGVGLALLVSFFLIVSPVDPLAKFLLKRQWFFAVLTMTAYLLLGVVFYLMARKGQLRHWMIWPAVAADSLFLLGNAWLGLMNTGLAGQLVFVLPPAWLVPLVFAFGVLRFDPYKQAFGVGVVVLGLAVLFLIPGEGREGLDVNRVTIFLSFAPNLMRLAMIALAGAVLVVAAQRMRRLLFRSLTEARQRANLTRYLPAQLASRLADDGLNVLRQGARQTMSIMFIDIRGFTSWSQNQDPGDVSRFISEYRSRVSEVVRAQGGIIDKFMGDAVMILFDGKDDAACALRCATGLAEEIARWSDTRADPIKVGIGIHRGDVFCGVVGGADRLEYSVFGDVVNSAARLEQLTKDVGFTVIASHDVLGAADADKVGWCALPAVELRGRTGCVQISGWSPTTQ